MCRLLNAPFSGTDRKQRRVGDRRIVETEGIICQVLDEIICQEVYPKSEITIVVHVLESDG